MTETLILEQPVVKEVSRGFLVEAELRSPLGAFTVQVETAGSAVSDSLTPIAAMCLPLAMARGWTLRSSAPISQRLLGQMKTIQEIYRFFLPGTRQIAIEMPGVEEPASAGRTAGSFFSGGVDSYYTYLKHRGEITRLLFGWGFDIRLEQESFAKLVTEQIRQMADELGAGLVEIKTNIREFSDRIVHWRYYHGAVLGGMASLLSPTLHTTYIASSQHYGDLFSWGSHPMLDPLWSTEAVTVKNDGCEAKRLEKLAVVVQNEVALRRLRVCFNNKYDRYNCNRCEKCYRTKIALYALGVLDQCQTFQPDFNYEHLGKLRYGNNGNVVRANQEMYTFLREHRPHPPLERAIRRAMRKPSWVKRMKERWRSLTRGVPASTALGAVVR